MRGALCAAVMAVSVVAYGAAWAACPAEARGHKHPCVNLGLAPQISRDIVAAEPIAAPPQKAPVAEKIPAYTGPTVGINHQVRRAPEIGYRWAIN